MIVKTMNNTYKTLQVSTFARAHQAALKKGYQDDLNTYIIISGMWTTSFYLGNFVGPTTAGFLVESLGFRVTTMAFFAIYLAMAVVDAVDLWAKTRIAAVASDEGYNEVQ